MFADQSEFWSDESPGKDGGPPEPGPRRRLAKQILDPLNKGVLGAEKLPRPLALALDFNIIEPPHKTAIENAGLGDGDGGSEDEEEEEGRSVCWPCLCARGGPV